MNDPDMWQLYQQTQFLMDQLICKDITFAIVTACNPGGQIMPLETNRVRDNILQREIAEQEWVSRSLYGCSPDFSHRERSWALIIERDEALSLAGRHQQNALFWVEQGELFLIPCLLKGYEETHLGRFCSRVTLRA